MGKKRGILLALISVALLGGVVWMLSPPAEPAYQGKSLRDWLNEICANGWGDTNHAASVAFREMGANAIPALVKALRSGDPPFFQRLILELNSRQSLVQFPVRQTPDQSLAASFALYAMGAKAKPAFPTLTNLLVHTNTEFLSAVPLAGMGPAGLPPLLAALTNQNAYIRYSAATALCWERSELNLVVPALIARLSDQDSLVHRTAVEVLGRLHAEPALAVPALMKDFPGDDPGLRSLIVLAIGEFETNAGAAVPMLSEALSDNDQTVRNDAAWALKHIDPAAAAKAGVK
jgi:HEAT repeat protein